MNIIQWPSYPKREVETADVFMPQELFGTEGVDMTIRFLKMNPAKFYSGMGHSRLILSTVDCVWWVDTFCWVNSYIWLLYI